MINDKNQTQKAGDNSTNYQAQVINVQEGLTYRDVKEICLDLIRDQFDSFREDAKRVVIERAERLVDSFISKVSEIDPELLVSVKDPSMLLALQSAQKSYIRAGDRDVADLLVDILTERAAQNERNLKQIILDESLEIIPKLTVEQFDVLSLIFLVNNLNSQNSDGFYISSLMELILFFENQIYPLAENLTKEPSFYEHLQYCNCVYGLSGERTLISEEFNQLENVLFEKFKNHFDPDSTPYDIRKFLSPVGDFSIGKLFDAWNNSLLIELTLTPVGKTIAKANIKRKIGVSYN
jgi:hypothetical protein